MINSSLSSSTFLRVVLEALLVVLVTASVTELEADFGGGGGWDGWLIEVCEVLEDFDESSLGYSSQKLVNSIRFSDHSVTFFSAIQWKQRKEHNLNSGVLVGGVKKGEKGGVKGEIIMTMSGESS